MWATSEFQLGEDSLEIFGSGERTACPPVCGRLACWRMRPRVRELCRFHFFKSAAIWAN